ncbi:hypothetical protein EVAR_29469_1 [Eumeta japonica]|uniref:Uncharacterized protein n=1 Tax=Eumeta variegata TaxID=151549 RepID=A0A4C1WU23_EUMVA|nr:hypothetical protein EVAR_29469_1 [Eumeta japonica]
MAPFALPSFYFPYRPISTQEPTTQWPLVDKEERDGKDESGPSRRWAGGAGSGRATSGERERACHRMFWRRNRFYERYLRKNKYNRK